VLQQLLEEKIRTIETQPLLDAMLKENVPAGKIRNLQEVFHDPAAKKLVREETIASVHTKRVSSIAFKWE
jgi:crotonobetainyl-CoA:carnitine CoA-transferase CaiB-like acyl-CoA transferase